MSSQFVTLYYVRHLTFILFQVNCAGSEPTYYSNEGTCPMNGGKMCHVSNSGDMDDSRQSKVSGLISINIYNSR